MRSFSDYGPRANIPGDLPAGPLLIVSPHLDDAALSCGALLERPEPVVILNVFAGVPDPPRRGPWDLTCGFADSAEGDAVRRAEERAAFADSPHHVDFLPLMDLQYLEGPRSPDEADQIRAAIRTWAELAGHGTVAIPAGAGARWNRILLRLRLERRSPRCHPDHLFVRSAALQEVAELPRADVILYEEFPYLLGRRADRTATHTAAAHGLRAELIELEIDRVTKARRLAAYTSQLPYLAPAGRRLDDPANLPPTERYWRFAPSSA